MITFFHVGGAQNRLTATWLNRLVTDEKESQASQHTEVRGAVEPEKKHGGGRFGKGPRPSSRRSLRLLKILRNLEIM